MPKDRHWRTLFATGYGSVWASSLLHPEAQVRIVSDEPPDLGVYLDDAWSTSRARCRRMVLWPDFGIPNEDGLLALAAALRESAEVLKQGRSVEIGCLGGHGRTGTALACLAVLSGEEPGAAILRVRREYCGHAIETRAQEEFVGSFATRFAREAATPTSRPLPSRADDAQAELEKTVGALRACHDQLARYARDGDGQELLEKARNLLRDLVYGYEDALRRSRPKRS